MNHTYSIAAIILAVLFVIPSMACDRGEVHIDPSKRLQDLTKRETRAYCVQLSELAHERVVAATGVSLRHVACLTAGIVVGNRLGGISSPGLMCRDTYEHCMEESTGVPDCKDEPVWSECSATVEEFTTCMTEIFTEAHFYKLLADLTCDDYATEEAREQVDEAMEQAAETRRAATAESTLCAPVLPGPSLIIGPRATREATPQNQKTPDEIVTEEAT